jgi:FkbH-like protein
MTQRTHQLNSTGRRYTEEELHGVMDNPEWLVAVARLTDRFGDYGIIGAALVNTHPAGQDKVWLVDLLMLSCRVEGRGIPAALLRWIMGEAGKAGAKALRAVYVVTERNLPIRLLFRQTGFTSISGDGSEGPVVAERSLEGDLPPYPEWLDLDASEVHTLG